MSIPFVGVSLLLLAWAGCFGLCRELAARKQIHPDWRVSWLLACVGWGALLTFVVELSSRWKRLNAPTLTATWGVGSVILCGAAVWLAWRRGALSRAAWEGWRQRIDLDWRQNWLVDAKLMVMVSAMLILALGFIAFSTPTTNWDSLTYHLPRVMHWIQQQSVEHYPTGNTRQLEFAPWSAFVVTNLHLLHGTDRLDNLVQWFAMLSCVMVTSFIAEQLLALTPSLSPGDGGENSADFEAHCAPESASAPLTPSLSPSEGERVPELSAALAKAEGRERVRFMGRLSGGREGRFRGELREMNRGVPFPEFPPGAGSQR